MSPRTPDAIRSVTAPEPRRGRFEIDPPRLCIRPQPTGDQFAADFDKRVLDPQFAEQIGHRIDSKPLGNARGSSQSPPG
jgi:hypothetical protein